MTQSPISGAALATIPISARSIVTAAGEAYSAGGDFELIKSIPGNNPVCAHARQPEARAMDLVYNVINCNKPIISVIKRRRGSALGWSSAASLTSRSAENPRVSSMANAGSNAAAVGGVACIILALLQWQARRSGIYLLACKASRPAQEARARSGWCRCASRMQTAERIALETAEELSAGAQSAIRWTKYALNNLRLRRQRPDLRHFDRARRLSLQGFAGSRRAEGLACIWRNASRRIPRRIAGLNRGVDLVSRRPGSPPLCGAGRLVGGPASDTSPSPCRRVRSRRGVRSG